MVQFKQDREKMIMAPGPLPSLSPQELAVLERNSKNALRQFER
jgi:hypothetical protein